MQKWYHDIFTFWQCNYKVNVLIGNGAMQIYDREYIVVHGLIFP